MEGTMEKGTFEREMSKAKTFHELDESKTEYYAGYMRGLRRNYHGENFGTSEEHQLWLDAANSDDPDRKQRGTGYKDGLEVK
jgi:hypothetical protein